MAAPLAAHPASGLRQDCVAVFRVATWSTSCEAARRGGALPEIPPRSPQRPGEAEIDRVDHAAALLRSHITRQSLTIDAAHIHGAQSAAIQALMRELLLQIGFGEEEVLQPQDGFVTRARPDFFMPLGASRGVLAEVERGGTVNNNHDLKGIWKAHIAAEAQHLFLIVPVSNFKPDGSARERPFNRVVHRAQSFFGDPRRHIVSLHVFGYGRPGRRGIATQAQTRHP